MQLQVLEGSVSGQDMKRIIEDLTHFLELFGRVELDVELGKQHHEFIEGNLRFRMHLQHLPNHLAELHLFSVD
jgi:hypothetical protein